jgi:uncharacterized protein
MAAEVLMLFAVFFEDEPEKAGVRAALMPQHLDFLRRHGDRIHAAGPLRDAADGSGAGGLWLVEASARDDVMRLVKEDPFWPTGLRRSVRVLVWNRVFAAGERLAPG